MRLPNSRPEFLSLTNNQKFFVSLWYRLTHSESLDSYRAQLHNDRTLVSELAHELELGICSPKDLLLICKECSAAIHSDSILQTILGFQFNLLKKRIQELVVQLEAQIDKENKKSVKPQFTEPLKFLALDISASIGDTYLEGLKEQIKLTVADEKEQFDTLERLTGAFVSDLIDRGWVLPSLHSWAGNLIKRHQEHAFAEKLDFMMRVLTAGEQPFKAYLRLSGGGQLSELKEFGGFSFSTDSPDTEIENPAGKLSKFLRQGPQIIFASAEVKAVDFKAATYSVHSLFDYCLDRIRFNYAANKITCGAEVLLIRGDGKYRLEDLSFEVANPSFKLNTTRFTTFNERLDNLINDRFADKETIERIRAAIRHYRLGQDAESFRDKFLSWWFGLEFLTKAGGNSIGENTARKAGHLLLERYVYWLLEDLKYSIKENIAQLPSSSAYKLPEDGVDALTPFNLLQLLQNQSFCSDLLTRIEQRPMLNRKVKSLAETFSNAKKTKDFLTAHHERVTWQLYRLYRIRCCLVHGSPIHSQLLVPVSNMEFYMRECLVVVLRTLDRYEHINSLAALFLRAEVAWATKMQSLTDKDANNSTICDVAFDGLVYHPNNFHS